MFLVTLVGGNARRYVGVKVDTRINVSVSVAIYSAAVPNRGGEFPQGGDLGVPGGKFWSGWKFSKI